MGANLQPAELVVRHDGAVSERRIRREGLFEGDPSAAAWAWAIETLEFVEIAVRDELDRPPSDRATGADDASLRQALAMVERARRSLAASDVDDVRETWERLDRLADREWVAGARLTTTVSSTGVTLFGGLIDVPTLPPPPAILDDSGSGQRPVGRTGSRAPSRRELVVRILLSTLVMLLVGTAAFVSARETVTQYRADTPVRAPADGCRASVTGSDGVTREVSLAVYKGACLQPDADGTVTVYVDADDPSVLAARRWWQWWLLATGASAALVVLAARSCVLAAHSLRTADRRPGPAVDRRS